MLAGYIGRQYRTLIGPDVKLQGDLVSRGLVEVRGRIEGNLRVAGKVLVCEEAVCNSDIVADFVEIAGQVHGDVRAEKMVVCGTGRLYGQSTCRRQVIRKGGAIVSDGSRSVQDAPELADPAALSESLVRVEEERGDIPAVEPVQYVQPVRPKRQAFIASF